MPLNIEQSELDRGDELLFEEISMAEKIIIDGPSPIEELYLFDRETSEPTVQENMEIPDWVDDPPKLDYIEEPEEFGELPDEDEINDLAVDVQVDSREKIEDEEIDFSKFVREGGGIEEPEPAAKDKTAFDESEIEDAQVVFEEEKEEVYDLENLSDPFDEFLEIEEEHGLITLTGETTPEIETLLKEVEERPPVLDDVDNIFWEPDKSSFVEEEHTEELDPELTFEDLIDEIQHETSFQNVDEEFDNLLEGANVVREGGSIGKKEQAGLGEAINLYSAKEYNAAIELLEKVIEKDPQNPKALSMLSDSLYQIKNYLKAAKSYERVLLINDKDTSALENLGIIHANRGDLNRAIIQWERLLNLNPQRQDIKESITRAKQYLSKI